MPKYETKLTVPKKNYRKGDLPTTKDEWVAYIRKCHDYGLTSRKRYEFQWVINMAYVLGYQHLVWNQRTSNLEIPKDVQIPITINRIASFIESRHAKLIKNKPVARVIPNTLDEEDRRAAKYSDQLLMHLWRTIGMYTERDRVTMMMLIFGDAFIKSLWDPMGGDSITQDKVSEDNDLILEDDGSVAEEDIFLGEVSAKALSPFCIIPANDAVPDVKDQPYMLERAHLSVSYLEECYPHLIGLIKKGNTDSDMTAHEKIVQRLSSPMFALVGGSSPKEMDSLNSQALAISFMMKPNYQYEKGVAAVVIGDKLAMIDALPNNYGRNIYPYVKFSEKSMGLHFWNQSTVERVIPIQKAYNRLKQQKVKNAALMANIKWLVAKGSGLQEDSLNDEEGEVIEFNSTVPAPKPAEIAPLPEYVNVLANELVVDFRDVSGQRESSISPSPNVTAGVAMSTAAELQDEIIGPVVTRLAESLSLVGEGHLNIANEEYNEPRKIKIFGEGNSIGIQWLQASDLRHHTDVHIEIESLYPEFRGAKRQTLFDLWDRKIVQDPEKVLKAFRYGDWDTLMEQDDKVEEAVFLEIARIKKGKEPEITPFQNQMLYVKRLTDWIQTPEFQRLIPERKQLAIQVLQARMGMIVQQMPGGGEPMGATDQASVNTPFGATRPAGSPGNLGQRG